MGKRNKAADFLKQHPFGQKFFLLKDNAIELTKVEIADAQLRAAVWMYFEGTHPVPVYTLANAAREIIDSIGNQMGIATTAHDVAETLDMPTKDVLRHLKSTANFFKHADRDADKKLVFNEQQVITVLFMACLDFEGVANGLPVEAIVFRVWFRALAAKVTEWPHSQQQHIRDCIRLFPGLRRAADLAEQKRIGLERLKKALADPLIRERFNLFDREVLLPPKTPKQ